MGSLGKKLSYIEWLNHNALLYSTENYFQYPAVNHNGREYGKEYRYVYIYIWNMVETHTTLFIH